MAMSFSRPDPASPAQVADASFSTGRRGFDQNEVRDFLRMVSAELGRLHERERFLERELRSAQSNPDLDTARLDDETLTRLLGEETARVLNAARESSHEIREKAEQSAARMLMEASGEATRLREEAEIEASRRRADAANDAEAELSMAKQQGREMVNEARAYRERVLSELARRRELAREQIEQLVHGRDRLMASFERARLVAVDVVAEMQPLGEPDEYVNLQPSTGPVPVMVAREDLHAAKVAAPADEASSAVELVADDVPIQSASAEVSDEASDVVELDAVADVVDSEPDEASIAVVDEEASRLVAVYDVDDDDEFEPADEIVENDAADSDDEPSDDVVVDLFARLRANADGSDDDTDDAADEADEAVEAPVDVDVDVTDADADADADVASSVDALIETDDTDVLPIEEAAVEAEAMDITPFERRDADLTPLIVASARKLKRVLADEQNEVLDALRRNDPVLDLDALLPWAPHHAERYSSVIADDLLLAAKAGATVASPERVTNLRKAAGRQAVSHASEMIAGSLVAPLRDRLERCISEGDGDNPAIAKKVRAAYRECKTQHIDEQLDDVLRAAHGRGFLAAVEIGAPVQWTPDPAHDLCPDCDDNRLAGDVAAGQEFPTGHNCAPAHPGCRCMLLPAGR
jgi:DivIVA domain-containing protein